MTTAAIPVKLLKSKLMDLIDEVLAHDGFSDIRIEVKILKRGQKEVILHCGKQYRFIVDNQDLKESINSN